MKKMNIGGAENEGPLRFFQNEGTQKPLYKYLKQPVTMRLDRDTVPTIGPGLHNRILRPGKGGSDFSAWF